MSSGVASDSGILPSSRISSKIFCLICSLASSSRAMGALAWHYKEYSDDETLAELEDKARVSKLGLWAEPNALPPWEFRKRRKIDDVPPQAVSSPRKEPTPRQAITSPQSQAGSHWLNTSSNTRHNTSCQYFKNTKKGRSCGPNEGKACGTCGG